MSNDLQTFREFCKMILYQGIISKDDMHNLVNSLLPGYRYDRSADGPRATKYLYDDQNNHIIGADKNWKVGMKALEIYADNDCKRAILESYKLQKQINILLRDVRYKYPYEFEISVKNNQINIDVSCEHHRE